MNKNILILTLVFLLPILAVFVIKPTEVFNLNPENVCYEVWSGFNNDAVGNSTFSDGKFILYINDTSGGWGLSKLSRGLMPHYWGLRYDLINEIELKRHMPMQSIILEIGLKLNNYKNYTATNSSMNVAIVLFFDGFITDYQLNCYQTEIQFFSYYGDKIQFGQKWFFTWRNDSVAQFKLADHLTLNKYKEYKIDLTEYIKTMMDYYGLDHVKLKHLEIFTEAYKGYCEFEVYYAKIYSKWDVTASYFMQPVSLILIGVFFCAVFFYTFYKR